MRDMSPAMKRQQGKMKAAWKAVKAEGLTGAKARDKVRSLMRGTTTSGASGRAASGASGRAAKSRRKRVDGSVAKQGRTPRARRSRARRRRSTLPSAPRPSLTYRQIPFMMTSSDIARSSYQDAAANLAAGKSRTTALTLEGLTQDIKTSQVGLHPTFRCGGVQTRLYVALGMM